MQRQEKLEEAKVPFTNTTNSTYSLYEYDQDHLIKKINTFALSRGPVSEQGHCHGLALLWLRRKSENCEHYFYNMIKKIIECPDDKLFTIGDEIENFYADIWLGQTPAHQRNVSSIIDVKEILMPSPLRDKDFSPEHLAHFFYKNVYSGRGVAIRSMTDKKHSVAVYCQGLDYFLFDANSKVLQSTKCKIGQLFAEISRCFYSNFKLEAPLVIPLEMDLIRPYFRFIAESPRSLVYSRKLRSVEEKVQPAEASHRI